MTSAAAQTQFSAYGVSLARQADWSAPQAKGLLDSIRLLGTIMGGRKNFVRHIGAVTIERASTGDKLGLAHRERIQFSVQTAPSAWSVIHELGHVWDAKNDWKLSERLEQFTHGFTNPVLAWAKHLVPGACDANLRGPQNIPGMYGRKPGCNAAGYFYGDKPSGSNWQFNRREDFAESLAMYCGWHRKNALAPTALGRITRYLLPNGSKDLLFGIVDNWSDYARFFYPLNGDYTKTARWNFMRELLHS